MCGRHQKFEAKVVAFAKRHPEVRFTLDWVHVDFNWLAQKNNTEFNPDEKVTKYFGFASPDFDNVAPNDWIGDDVNETWFKPGWREGHGHLYLPTIHRLAPIQPSHLMKSDPKFVMYPDPVYHYKPKDVGIYRALTFQWSQKDEHDYDNTWWRQDKDGIFAFTGHKNIKRLFRDTPELVPGDAEFSRYGQGYDFGEPKEGYGYALVVTYITQFSDEHLAGPWSLMNYKLRVEHECIDIETPEPPLPVPPPPGPLPPTKFPMQTDVSFWGNWGETTEADRDFWYTWEKRPLPSFPADTLHAPFKPYMIIRPNKNGPEYPFVHVCAPGETLSVPVMALAKKHPDDQLRLTWYQPNVDWLAKNYWASPFKDHTHFRSDLNNYKLQFPIIQVAAYYGDLSMQVHTIMTSFHDDKETKKWNRWWETRDDCPQDYDNLPGTPSTYQPWHCNRRNAPPTLSADDPVATSAKLSDPNYMRMDRYLVAESDGTEYRHPRRKYNIQGVLPESDKLWSEDLTHNERFTRFGQGYEFPIQKERHGYALAIECFSPKYKADTGNQTPGCEVMLRIEAECVKPSGSGEKKAEL